MWKWGQSPKDQYESISQSLMDWIVKPNVLPELKFLKDSKGNEIGFYKNTDN